MHSDRSNPLDRYETHVQYHFTFASRSKQPAVVCSAFSCAMTDQESGQRIFIAAQFPAGGACRIKEGSISTAIMNGWPRCVHREIGKIILTWGYGCYERPGSLLDAERKCELQLLSIRES